MNRTSGTGFSRREFLRRAGLTTFTIGATPALLAACGEDTTPTATGPAAGGASPSVPPASGTLDYFSWEGYDAPIDEMKAWLADNDVELNSGYIANHDDIQAKLKASNNSEGFDLITYYQGYKPLYAELGILSTIDDSKIPNLAGLNDFWTNDPKHQWLNEDGTRTGVPWTFGAIGITYDSAKIDEMSSWYDLLDPSLKGKISMPDDPVGQFTLTAHILGLDPGACPKASLADVVELNSRFVAQAESISPSFGDMTTKLVSGDIVACYQGWAAMNSFAAAEGVDTVKTNLPEEGSFTFADMYAIPTGADNVDTAHAFMNQILDPEVNARLAEYLVGAVTVDASVDLLNEETRALYPYEDIEGYLGLAPLYNNPPIESDEFVTQKEWTDAWQEIKAGGGA
jgi:spermidine/putrescine transport system substrate-binding protein